MAKETHKVRQSDKRKRKGRGGARRYSGPKKKARRSTRLEEMNERETNIPASEESEEMDVRNDNESVDADETRRVSGDQEEEDEHANEEPDDEIYGAPIDTLEKLQEARHDDARFRLCVRDIKAVEETTGRKIQKKKKTAILSKYFGPTVPPAHLAISDKINNEWRELRNSLTNKVARVYHANGQVRGRGRPPKLDEIDMEAAARMVRREIVDPKVPNPNTARAKNVLEKVSQGHFSRRHVLSKIREMGFTLQKETLDGHELCELQPQTIKELHDIIDVLLDEPTLASRTVGENVQL